MMVNRFRTKNETGKNVPWQLSDRMKGEAEEPPCELQDGEVHVWTVRLDTEPRLLDQAGKVLSAAEKERAARFVRPLDRERYVVCHGMTRSILAKYAGALPAELRFRTDSFG